MRYKNILITGGAGFIGSNLAVSFKSKYPSLKICVLDNLKRRGSELNLPRLKAAGIEFVHGDIRDPEDLCLEFSPELLLECSAEPSVLSGYGGSPEYVIRTNLVGTVNCLELARRSRADVVFLSTSRVYPYDALGAIEIVEKDQRFEWDSRNEAVTGWSMEGIDIDFTLNGPKTMYGATKISSEMILQEYSQMYGIKAVVNRCGVVTGPWQFGKVDQGVFSLWVLAHYFKKNLKYIGFGGTGKQVRDFMHVQDLFELIDLEVGSMDKVSGKTYNAGGGREVSLSLLETTRLCQEITGNKIDIPGIKDNRPGDVPIYIGNNDRVSRDLGWRPKRSAKMVLEDIFAWCREHEAGLKQVFS